jgi:hypothetical protein
MNTSVAIATVTCLTEQHGCVGVICDDQVELTARRQAGIDDVSVADVIASREPRSKDLTHRDFDFVPGRVDVPIAVNFNRLLACGNKLLGIVGEVASEIEGRDRHALSRVLGSTGVLLQSAYHPVCWSDILVEFTPNH